MVNISIIVTQQNKMVLQSDITTTVDNNNNSLRSITQKNVADVGEYRKPNLFQNVKTRSRVITRTFDNASCCFRTDSRPRRCPRRPTRFPFHTAATMTATSRSPRPRDPRQAASRCSRRRHPFCLHVARPPPQHSRPARQGDRDSAATLNIYTI